MSPDYTDLKPNVRWTCRPLRASGFSPASGILRSPSRTRRTGRSTHSP